MKLNQNLRTCSLKLKGDNDKEKEWVSKNPYVINDIIDEIKEPGVFHINNTKENIEKVINKLKEIYKKDTGESMDVVFKEAKLKFGDNSNKKKKKTSKKKVTKKKNK